MVVIIGAGSSVSASVLANGTGVVSANVGFQANVERLYQLGSFSPYDTSVTKQRTISINVYGSKPSGGGGTTPTSVTASTTCTDASSVIISFNPSACSGAISGFSDIFFVTSYSYSKENLGYGQESWSFTSKPVLVGFTGTIYMLRGIATGTIATGGDTISTGYVIDEAASNDSQGNQIQSETGSVSAGFPGTGNYEISREVVFSSVGGAVGKADGYRAQVSASIPVQPIYV